MTQEQFDKVCDIVREIDLLESAKKEIREEEIKSRLYGQDIGLNFCRWSEYDAKWEIINIKALASILKRHKELIKQEIDNRINELKKRNRRDMTRKERIEQESAINAAYVGGLEIVGEFSEEKLQTYQNGFVRGAEWADENPKNPWISTNDDLPCNHNELIDLDTNLYTRPVLAAFNNGAYYSFERMVKLDDGWIWVDQRPEITHWIRIPVMPKED